MDALLQDVRYGFRQLRRQFGSSMVAVVTLALRCGHFEGDKDYIILMNEKWSKVVHCDFYNCSWFEIIDWKSLQTPE